MADTFTTEYFGKFEFLFTDGDTRTLTLKNVNRTEGTSAKVDRVKELETLLLNADDPAGTLIIGDKAGATFRRINMYVEETTTTGILDLGIS